MKDLLDLQKAWKWLVTQCKNNLGWIVLLIVSFLFGAAWAYREITEDCKFLQTFRDGPYVYNCTVRQR